MLKKLSKIAIFAMLICISAVLTTAFLSDGIAMASDDKIQITLNAQVADSHLQWNISGDDSWQESGEWFGNGDDGVLFKFKSHLAEVLFSGGKIDADTKAAYSENPTEWNANDYFDVEFSFCGLGYVVAENDKTTIKYTRSDSDITLQASDTNPIVSNFSSIGVDYCKLGQSTHVQTSSLRFGNGVDVGEYDVSVVAYEEFSFDGRDYRIQRRSENSIRCTIEKANLPIPEIQVVQATYGTTAANISAFIRGNISNSEFLNTGTGEFSLCDAQTDSVFDGVNDKTAVIPSVKDGTYLFKFDYDPSSANYNGLQNIEVLVKIVPKSVTIWVSDVYTLVGQQKDIDQSGYRVEQNDLVVGDTVENLGVKLVCEADVNTVGNYMIKAEFDNRNYTPQCRNNYDQFAEGGKYMVFPQSITVTSPDGEVFEIYREGGFIEIKSAKIRILDGQSAIADRKIIRGYRIELIDGDGNVVDNKEKYYVSWSGDMNGAQYVGVGQGTTLVDVSEVSNGVALDKDNCEMYFYVDDFKPTNDEYGWQNILLISLATLFAIGLTAVWIGCRKAMTIGDVLHDCSVYMRKIEDKNADCADIIVNQTKNETQSIRKESVEIPKRQRHGKANKQKNGQPKINGGERK